VCKAGKWNLRKARCLILNWIYCVSTHCDFWPWTQFKRRAPATQGFPLDQQAWPHGCIAANKVRNILAGIVQDMFAASQEVEDDDMNIICIGARLVSFDVALELIQCFLGAQFSKRPRHQRRLAKIAKLEQQMEIQT
jgi:hypothetical protein